jgi:hypothetical protein
MTLAKIFSQLPEVIALEDCDLLSFLAKVELDNRYRLFTK